MAKSTSWYDVKRERTHSRAQKKNERLADRVINVLEVNDRRIVFLVKKNLYKS